MRICVIVLAVCSLTLAWMGDDDLSDEERERLGEFFYLNDELKKYDEESHSGGRIRGSKGSGHGGGRANKAQLDDYANFMGETEDYQSNQSCPNESEFLQKKVYPQALRWVKMFLKYSKLESYKINQNANPSDVVYRNLNFRISVRQLRALQQLSSGEKRDVTFSELDDYLSEILFNPVLRDVDDIITWSNRKLTELSAALASMAESAKSSETVSFLSRMSDLQLLQFASKMAYFIILITAVYKYHRSSVTFKKSFFNVVICMTLVEVFQEYIIELRRVELAHYMKIKQYVADKAECDPSKQGWFTKARNWAMGDPCLAMMEGMEIDPASTVSFLQCMFKCSLVNLFELPFTFIVEAAGRVASKVAGSGMYGALIYPTVFVFLLVFIAVVLMLLIGLKFKFSFWPFTSMELYFPTLPSRRIGGDAAEATSAIGAPASNGNMTMRMPTINITNIIPPPRRRSTSARFRIGAPRQPIMRQGSAPVMAIAAPPMTEDEIDRSMLRESDEDEQDHRENVTSSSKATQERSASGRVKEKRGIPFLGSLMSNLFGSNVAKAESDKVLKVAEENGPDNVVGEQGASSSSTTLKTDNVEVSTKEPEIDGGGNSRSTVESPVFSNAVQNGPAAENADQVGDDNVNVLPREREDLFLSMEEALRLENASFLFDWFVMLVFLSFDFTILGILLFLGYQFVFPGGFSTFLVVSFCSIRKRTLLGLPIDIPHQFQNGLD